MVKLPMNLSCISRIINQFKPKYYPKCTGPHDAKDCASDFEEQELARKLTDLRDNFMYHKESPSVTMMKINVLYRPPPISAYGLFDINLNFFYQMIAAIVTQCVILFQFQSFEKKAN